METVRRSLIIGINGYKPSVGSLRYCVSDARHIEQALNSRRDGFHSTESILLADGQANELLPTRANILENMIRLSHSSTTSDTIIVHFSGHGMIGKDDNLYLLPIDVSPLSLEDTSVSWKWIQSRLDECRAKNKILVLDACHSGAGRDIAATVRTSFKVAEELKQTNEGYVCISSCSGGQLSYELEELEHGIFSHYLAEGILGAADPLGHGIINIENLFEFVSTRTTFHAKQIRVEQDPYLLAKISGPLQSYVISAAKLDRPVNRVLILTEDFLLATVLKTGIQTTAMARSAHCVNDVEMALSEARVRLDYDAVYIDIENNWNQKREFILYVRGKYPIVPFVLVGSRTEFLNNLDEKDRERFRGYFFFDLNIPLYGVRELIADMMSMIEWDIGSRYGEITEY